MSSCKRPSILLDFMVVNGTFIEMKHERRTQIDGTIAFFLGCFLSSSESAEAISAGLVMLLELLGDCAFGGK